VYVYSFKILGGFLIPSMERERRKWGGGSERHYRVEGVLPKHNLTVWKVPRQCPLVLLVKHLINFGFKDVGADVVGGMESNFVRAILWRKFLKS
jgi:hypothetical protein